MARLEKREVLEIIIDRREKKIDGQIRQIYREAHRFVLHSNGTRFGDYGLENLDQKFAFMELLLNMKFPEKDYNIMAFGLVESVNVIKM